MKENRLVLKTQLPKNKKESPVKPRFIVSQVMQKSNFRLQQFYQEGCRPKEPFFLLFILGGYLEVEIKLWDGEKTIPTFKDVK